MKSIDVTPPRVVVRPRPLDRVESELVTLASQLTAATARLIMLIGELRGRTHPGVKKRAARSGLSPAF